MRGPLGCACANVSLDVAAGRLGVVAGPAGSGRTSLLLALAGRMRLVTGWIGVGEHRLPGDERQVRRLVAVAMAPPAMELDECLRVGEHIAERAMIDRARAAPAAVAEVLDVLGADPPRRVRVGELPPDERVLLAVALAASGRPAAVIVDDADRGCGPPQARRVWSGLSALSRCGCTVGAAGTRTPDTVAVGDVAVVRLPHPLDSDDASVAGEEDDDDRLATRRR